MKIFTLCDKCNNEFELKQEKNNAGIYIVFGRCPFCNTANNRWLRIEE